MTTGFPRETGYTYDTLLELLTSQTDAVTDLTLANGSTVDMAAAGSGGNENADSEFKGDLVIDVSAIEVATGDEVYTIVLNGSDNSDFTTGDQEELALIRIGDSSVFTGDVDSDAGRYVVPFSNKRNTRMYRYCRLEITIAGTIATGITWAAFIGKRKTG